MLTGGLTKMRIPSASFCQRSTILVPSSSAALEYVVLSCPKKWILLGIADSMLS